MCYRQVTGIYRIKNILDNKYYIGSSKSVYSRLNCHKNQLLNNKHFNKHLQSSYNKYGLDNFLFELIEETILDKNILQEREEYYISYYNSNNRLYGYNKRLDCSTNLGIKLSPEHIEKLRISHLGNKRSKEAQIKISEAQNKSVYKIDVCRNIVTEYKSIQDAGTDSNIHVQSISACCRGKLNSTGGYYWCFVENYQNMIYKSIKNNVRKYKKYKYINIENDKFYTLDEIVEITNIKKYVLVNMFTGRTKNITKFIRYE